MIDPALGRAIGQIQLRELEADWAEVHPAVFASINEAWEWNRLRLLILDYAWCVFE